MAKNDYRRQLIMLRGLEKGYSGHARLEKRVLTGTMDFMTTASETSDQLEAAFVGVRGGKTVSQTLGSFKDTARGQKALLASFDPRNIAGMDLSEVSAAVVSRVENGRKKPVMYACINGVCALDWDGIQSTLNGDPPVSKEPVPLPITQPVLAETSSAENDLSGNQPAPENAQAQPPTQKSVPEEPPAPQTPPAISLLDIDPTIPWPEDVESLRLLFMTKPADPPFDMDGYVFIRAKMADETGIDHCAVGIRAENGKVTGVSYAIPMPYTSEPPAGLEDYIWMGDQTHGWWVTTDDLTES
ncbi:MAG: hypothetical protein IJN21_05225 [Clostridia bacterium]|nr:hypothetical protein [Clostridia bacterium]